MANKTKNVFKFIILTIILCFILAAVNVASTQTAIYLEKVKSDQSTQNHLRYGDAYVWITSIYEPVSSVKRGGIFFVHITSVRDEVCTFEGSYLMLEKTQKLFYHYDSYTNWLPAGNYDTNELFRVPKDIPLGHWSVIKKTINHCHNSLFYTTSYEVDVDITD